MQRVVELRLQVVHQLLLLLRQRSPAGRGSGLNRESLHDAMERGAVVDTRRREPQEVPDVLGRLVAEEFDRDRAGRRVEHRAYCESVGGSVRRRTAPAPAAACPGSRPSRNRDAFGGRRTVGSQRRLGDLLDDVHAFGDTAEHGVLAVERGLVGDADEELCAALSGVPAECTAETAPRVSFSRVQLRLQHAESASAV